MPAARRTRFALIVLVCLGLLAAACSKSTTTTSGSPAASPTPLTGSATIAAAASLSKAFDKMKADFIAAHPGVHLTMNYQGSQALVTAIQGGAPTDVFASADTTNMNKLIPADVVTGTAKTFAKNLLQIVVKSGNPKGIQTLADLAKPGVVVVLADPSVPAGKYAAQALAGASVTVHPVSLELQVTSVLTKVSTGNADAGVVYQTDVASGGSSVTGVAIPAAQNIVATYPIAPLKNAPNPAVAQAFVDYVLSAAGQATLASFGFLPPA